MDHLVELLRRPALDGRTLCMGILNITPDSFHDGGAYLQMDKALAQFDLLVEQGADMIDIGGMSSRPGHTKISAQEELQRILPVIERCAERSTIPMSVDTDREEVAAAALSAGVRILNDCSGRLDSPLFALAARTQAPIVIMHRHGVEGRHANIVEEVMAFFSNAMAAARAVGVQDEQFYS